jgi:hypothetical protein
MVKLRSVLVLLVLAACARATSSDRAPAPSSSPAAIASDAGAPLPDPPAPAAACEDVKALHIFAMPGTAWTGAPLRVIALSDRPVLGELRLHAPSATKATTATKTEKTEPGALAASSTERHGGPPYFWIATVPAPIAGRYTASLVQSACEATAAPATLAVTVSTVAPREPPAPNREDGLWPSKRAWSHALEELYSAWIETLFDAPEGEQPSWAALHEVLRDKSRNLLFDYLGAGEDSANAPVVRPDCADLPFFLRAYFAFKFRLPFGIGQCNRGGGGAPPSCTGLLTNEDPPATAGVVPSSPASASASAVKTFGAFLGGKLADRAHSGSGRAPFEDENADYYPVALTSDSLRPGTVFADPYGHVLVVAKRFPQNAERGGVLLAIDGQPDGTVARKRFWRGNFLYATEKELGGPGWKRFRPLARREGHLVRLDDESIKKDPEYADLSRDAGKLDVEGFYDAMDDVLSPRPLDPDKALVETILALEEQVRTRVKSIDNGRKWLESAKEPAPMPDGAEIFETNGAWEDFATPSRDLRILIAMDVVRNFPARVGRRPERYKMPAGKSPAEVEARLVGSLARELAARTVTYTKTGGAAQTLTLAEVMKRSAAFEMAYDLNDCAEVRWGAPEASEEAKTCTAHAPPEQRERMATYRAWFHERRRPARK